VTATAAIVGANKIQAPKHEFIRERAYGLVIGVLLIRFLQRTSVGAYVPRECILNTEGAVHAERPSS